MINPEHQWIFDLIDKYNPEQQFEFKFIKKEEI